MDNTISNPLACYLFAYAYTMNVFLLGDNSQKNIEM